jgi:hypothetical protein
MSTTTSVPDDRGEGSLGQADRSHEVGHRCHLAACRRVAGIERVPGGECDHEPTGASQMERLDEEVVVQGVAGRGCAEGRAA